MRPLRETTLMRPLTRDHETTNTTPDERPPWWQTTLMREQPDQTTLMRQPWWAMQWAACTTMTRDHPHETAAWWDCPDERPPSWDSSLMTVDPAERLMTEQPEPPWWETPLMRGHPPFKITNSESSPISFQVNEPSIGSNTRQPLFCLG